MEGYVIAEIQNCTALPNSGQGVVYLYSQCDDVYRISTREDNQFKSSFCTPCVLIAHHVFDKMCHSLLHQFKSSFIVCASWFLFWIPFGHLIFFSFAFKHNRPSTSLAIQYIRTFDLQNPNYKIRIFSNLPKQECLMNYAFCINIWI